MLEARDRVGGRVLNVDLGNGVITEGGAEFIGPTQDHIAALAKDVGVDTFPTYNTGDNIYFRNGIGDALQLVGPARPGAARPHGRGRGREGDPPARRHGQDDPARRAVDGAAGQGVGLADLRDLEARQRRSRRRAASCSTSPSPRSSRASRATSRCSSSSSTSPRRATSPTRATSSGWSTPAAARRSAASSAARSSCRSSSPSASATASCSASPCAGSSPRTAR